MSSEVIAIDYLESVPFNENLTIKFSSVQDSRCPEGVVCVRAGELFATLLFKNKNSEVEAKFCISGECLQKNNIFEEGTYYSEDSIMIGLETYSIRINDFTPKTPQQSNQLSAYSLTIELIE